nr:hypothetical protein [Microbacterium bovistercoris]
MAMGTKQRPVIGGTGGEGHQHRFDPISGWCAFCNLRDDGRLVSRDGAVWRPGPEYGSEQLHTFLTRATEAMK